MIDIRKYRLESSCIALPGTVTTWGAIIGDIGNQSDLVAYISTHGGGGGVAAWGSISGNISDQTDLMNLLSSFATESWVSSQGYLTEVPSGYATQSWVESQGYLTSHQDLTGYATESWVTEQGYITSIALSGYATESWVAEQGYITSIALSGYATESWVEGQSFLTSSSLKTINEQSLVGEGDIEIGGLTPEQEEAIAPLEDPAEGVLYTMNVLSRIETDIPFNSATSNDYSGYLYNVGDKVYWFNYSLYEFDDDSLSFNYLGYFQGDQSGKPLWGDSQGRFYCGIDKVLNFEDMTIDTIDMNCTDYSYNWGYNRHSIWVGEYGIYNLNADAWKFDEDTQTFSTWTINTTNNLGYISQYGVWYDGHYVWSDGNNMYELKEYEDRLEVVVVSEPYFPMLVNGNSIDMYRLHNVNGDLYYCYEYNTYELIDGAWESISVMNRYDGPFYWTYQYGHGVSYLDYLIGCEGQFNSGMFTLIKMTDGNEEKTAWQNVAQVAVDLQSDQTVKGYKRFDNIKTNSISLGSLSPNDTTTSFNLNNNTTTANSIKFNVGGAFTLNDIKIATVEKCIVNKTVIPYGGSVTDVLAFSDKSPYRYYHWTTHTGRLFYDSNYEFNGSTWSSISSVYQGGFSPSGVVKAGNSTFMVYGDTAIWDDANSEFVQIVNTAPNSGWYIWPCGDGELRAAGDYKLVNNGGTWSWESDPVSGYKYGMTYYIEGHVYVLSLEDTGVYEYVESTKTYTKLGEYTRWNDYSFECCGEIFFFWNAQEVRRIDFTAVDPLDDTKYIDVMTAVPYSNNDFFYGEYNGYMYFYRDYDHLAYCYDDQYDLPAVPATNGTYVLKATRSGDSITYSWVLDEVPQAVQITNEILS